MLYSLDKPKTNEMSVVENYEIHPQKSFFLRISRLHKFIFKRKNASGHHHREQASNSTTPIPLANYRILLQLTGPGQLVVVRAPALLEGQMIFRNYFSLDENENEKSKRSTIKTKQRHVIKAKPMKYNVQELLGNQNYQDQNKKISNCKFWNLQY